MYEQDDRDIRAERVGQQLELVEQPVLVWELA